MEPPQSTSWAKARTVKIENWFTKYERPISTISLVGGFIVDWITLQRIDTLLENFLVLARLLVVAVCIVLLNRAVLRTIDTEKEAETHFWLINILQFAFGGLLSTFLVFYFRSGSIFVSWPFLLLLGIAFAINERWKHNYSRASFQISFLFLSIYLFSIFSLPIVFRTISPLIFVASGVVSLIAIFGYLKVLRFFTPRTYEESKKILAVSIATIWFTVNALYFLQIIPPIPLSLKDAGVYHAVTKNEAGDYVAIGEKKSFWSKFRFYDRIHIKNGEGISVYSSIFSPTKLNTGVIHNWQWYNENTKRWVTEGKISLSIVGGRGDGFRTYSTREIYRDGSWRVSVENSRGQVLGRVLFNVIFTSERKELITDIKY